MSASMEVGGVALQEEETLWKHSDPETGFSGWQMAVVDEEGLCPWSAAANGQDTETHKRPTMLLIQDERGDGVALAILM